MSMLAALPRLRKNRPVNVSVVSDMAIWAITSTLRRLQRRLVPPSAFLAFSAVDNDGRDAAQAGAIPSSTPQPTLTRTTYSRTRQSNPIPSSRGIGAGRCIDDNDCVDDKDRNAPATP